MDSPKAKKEVLVEGSQNLPFRIGFGTDSHRFCQGRKLLLGGVEIPCVLGLDGHSDADVLLHALIDAVLGAMGWGDIGRWFPNTDLKYSGIDSRDLFSEVWKKCRSKGWLLANCDCVITAEEPKLSPHMDRMCDSLAELFSAPLSSINIKAKTAEGLGSLGRKEGMAAQAVVLLYRGF